MGVANYWTNLTSITGFTATANYASGTPTADCSYGGWIRVGSNVSYQAHGTLAHEILHGIGVGTHSTYTGDIRENNTRGIWRGKRATRFLQFWDNSDGARLTGDQTHFWATGVQQSLSYTINGANEDNHSDASYYGNSLLAQAVVEDGLAPVDGNLQGLAYTLDSDGKTFFIRNSDENYGLKSDYLVDNNGTLQLRTLSGDEARQAGNNAQWQLTFDPAKQTYRIKNKQTGRYIYYASDNTNNGFRAATSTTNEIDLRLQLSFVDVTIGKGSTTRILDGYHIMRATSTPSPQAFCAKSATATGSTAFSNTFAATAQRWVFIDVDDLNDIDDIISAGERYDLDELIANIRNLAGKPHAESQYRQHNARKHPERHRGCRTDSRRCHHRCAQSRRQKGPDDLPANHHSHRRPLRPHIPHQECRHGRHPGIAGHRAHTELLLRRVLPEGLRRLPDRQRRTCRTLCVQAPGLPAPRLVGRYVCRLHRRHHHLPHHLAGLPRHVV